MPEQRVEAGKVDEAEEILDVASGHGELPPCPPLRLVPGMLVVIVFVRKANDAVDGLRSEMFVCSRSRHHQRHVRILDLGSSVRPPADAELQACWAELLERRGVSVA